VACSGTALAVVLEENEMEEILQGMKLEVSFCMHRFIFGINRMLLSMAR
jgi:hypothetical protein